jgi:hypothetical protein
LDLGSNPARSETLRPGSAVSRSTAREVRFDGFVG